MVPTGQRQPRSSVDFGGSSASPITGWRSGRPILQRGWPYAIAELTTPATSYTQLSGCFVATAAWGSALGPRSRPAQG